MHISCITPETCKMLFIYEICMFQAWNIDVSYVDSDSCVVYTYFMHETCVNLMYYSCHACLIVHACMYARQITVFIV